MYTTDKIFPFLPIKDLINEDEHQATTFKMATDTKPSVSHLRVLFCTCVVKNVTAHVGTKTLNMRHQAHKCLAFCEVSTFLYIKTLRIVLLFVYIQTCMLSFADGSRCNLHSYIKSNFSAEHF